MHVSCAVASCVSVANLQLSPLMVPALRNCLNKSGYELILICLAAAINYIFLVTCIAAENFAASGAFTVGAALRLKTTCEIYELELCATTRIDKIKGKPAQDRRFSKCFV